MTVGAATAKPSPSELRIAATFVGGVSLAVWMGGLARELNLLMGANRTLAALPVEPPSSYESQQVLASYAQLLDVLSLDATIDVISGTSAGGINAAVLGLANVRHLDLGPLRELWFQSGSLGGLLRDPFDDQTPSLLYGDNVMLDGLRTGLEGIIEGKPVHTDDDDPTRVFITTTLLEGEASRFLDDYGTVVNDVNKHGLFTFSAADLADAPVSALALAARCSASFPAAFEPGLVLVGTSQTDHPDMSRFINTTRSQFVADGGLLANRPLTPALQAVFDRSAGREVRRVLAFVVPTTGATPADAELGPALTVAETPTLGRALAGDFSAVLSQSIATDLADISAHNATVSVRRDGRRLLAVLGARGDRLATPLLYQTYRQWWASTVANDITLELLNQAPVAGAPLAAGWPAGFAGDADEFRQAAFEAALARMPSALPQPGDVDQMAAMGRRPLDDAEAAVISLVQAGYRLVTSPPDRAQLDAVLQRAHDAMPKRHEQGRQAAATAVRAAALGPGLAPSQRAQSAVQAMLDERASYDGDRRAAWVQLGTAVLEARPILVEAATREQAQGGSPPVSDPAGDVHDLLAYLAPDTTPPELVASRLFDLHMAQSALTSPQPFADQALELVQMSADTRTALDPRSSAGQKLTGLQMHHFGAFYKSSWRANDWMWGRLDGAGWIVHVLLDPRLLQRAAAEVGRQDYSQRLMHTLQSVAGGPPPSGLQDGIRKELAFLLEGDAAALPTSLPLTAIWVASGIQRLIASEELAHVAERAQMDIEQGGAPHVARAFLGAYENAVRGVPGGPAPGAAGVPAGATTQPVPGTPPPAAAPSTPETYPAVPAALAAQVLQQCRVSGETISGEEGSELFSRTVVKSAAVALAAVSDAGRIPAPLRPIIAMARTVTRLAYQVLRVGTAARYAAWTGLVLIAVGAIASTSTLTLLSAGGLVAVLAGALLLGVGAGRRLSLAAGIVGVVVLLLLILAGFIPYLRDHLFSWLETTAIPGLEHHPVTWALVVIILLLPPLTVVVGYFNGWRRRRRVAHLHLAAAAVSSGGAARPGAEPAADQAPLVTEVASPPAAVAGDPTEAVTTPIAVAGTSESATPPAGSSAGAAEEAQAGAPAE